MEELYQALKQIAPVPQEEWELFAQDIQFKKLKSQEYLLREGDSVNCFYYLVKGLVRIYYVDQEGNEFVKVFQREGEVVGPYVQMIQGLPSSSFIECLEDVEFYLIPYKNLLEAYNRNPLWLKIGLKLLEKYFIQKEERVLELLKLDAGQRYQKFLSDYPDLVNRIPKYHLASYLGIKPESLSRLLRKVGKT